MKDPDEPVGDVPQSGVVRHTAGPLAVVVRPRAWRAPQGAHGLAHQRVDQPCVADTTGLTVDLRPDSIVTGLVPA